MASLSYSQKIKKIKEDIRVATDGIARDLSNKAKQDLTRAVKSIIDNFYESYKPEYYVRTNNLYNMIVPKTVDKYGSDNAFIASVSTMSVVMDDVYGKNSKKNITPDVIYDLMWNAGHRGLPLQSLPSWYPSIDIDGHIYTSNTPHNEMKRFIDSWGKDFGRNEIKDISKKYKSNKEIKF